MIEFVTLFLGLIGGPKSATSKQLRKAMGQMTDSLDRQRVVWLEGRHFPPSIRLTAAARAASVVAR